MPLLGGRYRQNSPLLSLSAQKKGEALREKDLGNQAEIIRRNASPPQNPGFGIFSRESHTKGLAISLG